MPTTRVLIINTMGVISGDTAMLLLGVSQLPTPAFQVYAVSIPRGKTYDHLRSLPNIVLKTMELGGDEVPPPRPLGHIQRYLEALLAIPRIVALVKREQIDVIYTIDRTIAMSIAHAVSLLTRCPLLYGAHITFYLDHSRRHRMVLKHARRITVVSGEMRSKFLPYIDHPTNIVAIPNAIQVERFDPSLSGSKIREECGVPPNAKVIVLVGRINPWKGQRELIHAARIILEHHPDTYFLIAGAGDDDYDVEIEQLIDELKVGQSFRLLGYRSDVPEILAAANIATMPSYYEEFGLVALEAMAMEKPVVACRSGGVPEFLIDGETGLLVTPEDSQDLAMAILKLLNNPQLASQIGKRGRQHVLSNYSSQVYGTKIANLLKDFSKE